ncbi:MAG: hypothetical protein HFG62_02845 [Lachnospiraceae bacterium]|jgi:hypothetical protein|nr:hypothetical protein [Lachnospiraceae bacterium]
MEKKILIPTVLGVLLLCGIIFTVVYKKTSGPLPNDQPVVQTLAPKETDPIETRVTTDNNNLTDFEVNETKEPPKSIIVDSDGKALSEEEAIKYEESIADSVRLEIVTKEDGSEAIVDINDNEIGVEADTGEQAQETMSGQVMEEIQEDINDYTYKQSYERTREFVRMEIQSQKEAGNTDFMDITDEYINNATPEELDALYIKVMQTVGFER